MVVQVGFKEDFSREQYVLELARPENIPADLRLPSRYFVCLIAWDASAAPTETIALVAQRLLEAGGVYFCCWGPSCERVHDIIDGVIQEVHPAETVETVVMTTWHGDEPLTEALWFLLRVAWPADAYADECRATLGVSVGNGEWASQLRRALSSPDDFIAKVLASEEAGE